MRNRERKRDGDRERGTYQAQRKDQRGMLSANGSLRPPKNHRIIIFKGP